VFFDGASRRGGYNPRYGTDPDHLADLPGIEISVQVEYPKQ